tara:strand:+ start:3778 stop:3969 length:192 start_codon:yes stop_codon:yes gene_type:complete
MEENETHIVKVADELAILTKDIKSIRSDLSYIKTKIAFLAKQKDDEEIKEVQTKQEGWIFWGS